MSTFNQPADAVAGALAQASQLNNLADAVAAAFALLPDEDDIRDGLVSFGVDTGAADAYLVALTDAPDAYVDGLLVSFLPLATNTGASTINVNSLGVKSIRRTDSSALEAGDITIGVPIDMRYSSVTGYFHVTANAAAEAADAAASAAAAAISAAAAAASEAAAALSEAAAAASAAAINAATFSNTDVDTGTETCDSFADSTGHGAWWDYIVSKGSAFRRGTVHAVWDPSLDTVQYTEGAALEIGDTSDLIFSVDISSDAVRLRATAGSDNWSVTGVRRTV